MWRIILLAILGGAVPTFSKIVLEVFPAYTFVFLRFIIAAVILVPLFKMSKEKIDRKDIPKFVLISLLGTGNIVFFTLGVRHTTATISQLLYAVVPIIVAILSVFILKSHISKQKVVGILLGFVGVIIITLVPNLNNVSIDSGTILGNALVMIAVTSYALYTVFSKKLQEKSSPLAVTTMMVLTTIAVQIVLIPLDVSKYSKIVSGLSVGNVLCLVYVGAIGTALWYLLYQRAIKKTNPVTVSMLFYLQPICTFFWSYALLSEKLTFSLLIGSVFILVGAGLVTHIKNE